MADKLTDTAKGATDKAQQGASEGSKKWEAMSEDQKKQTFDALPADQKKGKTYMGWISEGYNHQYENWMPWIEDKYLSWFTNDNKTSYAAKGRPTLRHITSLPYQSTDLFLPQTPSTKPKSPASPKSTSSKATSTTSSATNSAREASCSPSATWPPRRA